MILAILFQISFDGFYRKKYEHGDFLPPIGKSSFIILHYNCYEELYEVMFQVILLFCLPKICFIHNTLRVINKIGERI